MDLFFHCLHLRVPALALSAPTCAASCTVWPCLHRLLPRFAARPPFIPTINSNDDVSNFEEFPAVKPRPRLDDPRAAAGFTGKNLPFVGFTFTKAFPSSDGQVEPSRYSHFSTFLMTSAETDNIHTRFSRLTVVCRFAVSLLCRHRSACGCWCRSAVADAVSSPVCKGSLERRLAAKSSELQELRLKCKTVEEREAKLQSQVSLKPSCKARLV